MSLITIIVSLIVFGGIFTIYQRRRPSHPYPPGPKGKPLVGNIADMPKEYPWLTFFRWGKEYGPLTYLNIMGQSIVIINDHQTAVDLIEKRGAIYSDRYWCVTAMEFAGFDISPLLQSYTPRLRFHRKLMHSALGQATVQRDVWPLQEKETRVYLNNLLDRPDAFLDDLLHCEGGITLKLAYGAVKDGDLDFAELSKDLVTVFEEAAAGHLVDAFPIQGYSKVKHLPAWMPGAGFKRKAAGWKKIVDRNFKAPFEMVKRMRASGEAPASYCTRLLEENDVNGGGKEVESSILETAATMYLAGTDTTTGVVQLFFLVMLLHPEVQQRAQEEIARVVGSDRLPSLQDRASLPYVEAVLLECLRFQPMVTTGIPHCLRQDDMYNGYHIPAGSIVYINLWGISRDEKQYPRPEEFDPSRWMTDKNNLSEVFKPLDPRDFVFGYGRRVCPGTHIAQASIWIAIASILATFNIKPSKNAAGEDVTPPLEFVSGLVGSPKPFTCNLEPRSEKAIHLIRVSVNHD